jgi:hypothetical protein
MPELHALGDRTPCTIVDRYDDGRVLINLTRVNATIIVDGADVHAADGEPAIVRPRRAPGRLGDLQFRVLEALHNAGAMGHSDDELVPITGLLADSAGKRRIELVRLGYVIDTGDTRTTRRGGTARVWQITTAGRDAVHRHRSEGAA